MYTYLFAIAKYVAINIFELLMHKCIFYSKEWIHRNGVVGTEHKCIFNFCEGCQMAF